MARRHMKGERPDNTLQSTALVHEMVTAPCHLTISGHSFVRF